MIVFIALKEHFEERRNDYERRSNFSIKDANNKLRAEVNNIFWLPVNEKKKLCKELKL